MITISKELQEKLKNCKSDVEFSKMLADNCLTLRTAKAVGFLLQRS